MVITAIILMKRFNGHNIKEIILLRPAIFKDERRSHYFIETCSHLQMTNS